MRYFFTMFLVGAFTLSVKAQLEESYRSPGNPNYWKNKMPDKGYWQQDVHYKIDANIDENTHVVTASETLKYWNNSPDTLRYVYFHLFQNAFIKGSYLHDLERANKVKPRLGKYEKNGLGTVVSDLKADGKTVETILDNTVLKVLLNEPLYPGKSVVFTMDFKTYYDNGGSTRRRMKMYDAWGFKHYNGVQWYPKICVYDRKFGWDTYQHLNKEFYGDFGTFDVRLNFASNYIVEATGVLENRDEVLPKDLREKLDIKNFANKKWNEPPSTIIEYKKGERKTWHFTASNVHDFAFTADPSYRIGTKYWNGIECVAIAQEPHASGWQNGAEYVAKIIQTFSEDIGMYEYPKMVAADAADGMEYPMITLDGGSDPGYRGLLVHEIGHNWFYGMVGSNETYRAAMDEGFTQFLTAWGLKKLEGETEPERKPKNKLAGSGYVPTSTIDKRALNVYTYDALNRIELPINTHSNDFHDALHHEGGYRQVYYKPASMLYNLQYTLGDSLFLKSFQHYFKQWSFAHPYFEDFRNSIIQYSDVDLNWFFDQWLETTKRIDYKVGRINSIPGNDSFNIRFKRQAEMQMPIDFTVYARDGEHYSFHIPNTWFVKETKATVLPKWFGIGRIHPEYSARVYIPSGIKKVQIDTTYRLADIDMQDNVKKPYSIFHYNAIKYGFDMGKSNPWDRRQYRMYIRPDLWWNPIDGIKAGVHFEGDYLFTLHKVDAAIWLNTHVLQEYKYTSLQSEGWYERYAPVNYTFNYLSPLLKNIPKLELLINSRFLDGLWYHRLGLNWLANDRNTVQLYGKTMWRPRRYDTDYLLYQNEWSSITARPNSSLNIDWTHNVKYVKGTGSYMLSLRAPMFTGNSSNDFDYAYAQLEAKNYNYLGKLEVRTRLFARYGTGNNIPYESALFLAGANPESLMENKYTRSIGFVPIEWASYSFNEVNHFQYGGGLNLRGYAGYIIADERNGQILTGYKAKSGISGNLEVDVDNYFRIRPKLTRNWLHADVYAFADAGVIELNSINPASYWNIVPEGNVSDLRVDAGIGTAFTIKKWWKFEKAQPLTIRADFPFFLNRPPSANPDYLDFRWIISVNRTF